MQQIVEFTLEQLKEYSTTNIIDKINRLNIFLKACRDNNLEVAKWIYSSDIVTAYHKINIFEMACHRERLELAEWIYSLDDINIYADNEIFMWMCKNNNLKMAKWLYSLADNNKVSKNNLHRYDNHYRAFLIACGDDHLEMAQWLYSLSEVNIRDECEDIFRIASPSYDFSTGGHVIKLGTHTATLQWLLEVGRVQNAKCFSKARVKAILKYDPANIKYIPKECLKIKSPNVTSTKNNLCSICTNNYNAPTILHCCRVIFCFECLLTTLKSNGNYCPHCRHRIKNSKEYSVITDEERKE